jgi:hypothetical protein
VDHCPHLSGNPVRLLEPAHMFRASAVLVIALVVLGKAWCYGNLQAKKCGGNQLD